ncbi:MAG: metalloprotease PmbA [Wenzhouxiangellaceae bacterium]
MNDSANQSTAERPREQRRELEQIVGEVLAMARQAGASAAQAEAYFAEGLGVTVRLGEVDILEHTRDRGLAVTVYLGHKKGSVSCGDLQPETLRTAVERAVTIARYTEEDPYCGLADAELMAAELPELDLWHPTTLSADQAIERALRCEQAARDSDSRITNSDGASVERNVFMNAYGNSHGFLASEWSTVYNQSAALIAGRGDSMQSDYWWDSSRVFSDLEAPETTGKKAAQRTLARLNGRQLPTMSAPVLFTPRIASGVIGHLVNAVTGSALYQRSSFLVDQQGERLFPEWFTIDEDPLLRRGMRSSAFDNDGVATRQQPLIADGRLARYVLSAYSGRRLGLSTTANAGGVRNLIVRPGADDFDAMVRRLGRGLIVDDVMGQGVNTVTGDYSRGASGFWVEDGEIAYPVEEVTIASNLRDMFANVVAVGSDLDHRRNIQSPSLLLAKMTIAGS